MKRNQILYVTLVLAADWAWVKYGRIKNKCASLSPTVKNNPNVRKKLLLNIKSYVKLLLLAIRISVNKLGGSSTQ